MHNIHNHNTFCFLPFSHIFLRPDGKMSQCCKGNTTIKDNGKPILYDIDRAFNSDHMNQIRLSLLAGVKAPECNYCWKIEENGGKSMRNLVQDIGWYKRDGIDLDNFKIHWIEASLSNKCNLKCLMCSPLRSNQIGIEEGHSNSDRHFPIYDYIIDNAKYMREMSFMGGEPLLHDEMYDILEYFVNNGHSDNISLKFNTNATVIRNNFFNLIEQFRHVTVDISIEGHGKRNEYIRFPSKWDITEKNIILFRDKFPENFAIKINTVFDNLTVMGFSELEEWASRNELNQYYNKLTSPSFLQSHILPKKIKKYARKILEDSTVANTKPFINELMKPYTKREKNAFIEYIKRKDKLRGINILDYCPEFEEWFS